MNRKELKDKFKEMLVLAYYRTKKSQMKVYLDDHARYQTFKRDVLKI